MPSKKAHAIALALQGFKIFPLQPNGKTPAHEGSWRRTASSDPARVGEMWTCPVTEGELDYNVGIALDHDVMVFDEDTRDGKHGKKSRELLEAIYDGLPNTRTVRSASGGIHRYFKTDIPVSNSASKVGQHIDIKSEGGYVVGPGSTIDGQAYEIVDPSPLEPAPEWLATLAGKPREKKEHSAEPLIDLDSQDAIARATEYLKNKAPDSGTFTIAAKLKDFGVSQETCTALMLEYWRDARNLDKDDSHIGFRVANAYRYGQNAPGISAAEAEFEPVEIDQKQYKRRGLYAVRWQDAKPVLDQAYLIDDVIDLGTMVVTYGDSNAGKTYAKLDQCFHIASGNDWNGHKVKQGLVVYVAAEGGKGFFKRIEAFKRKYDVKELPFSLVPCPIDLFSESGDTEKLIKLIRQEEAHFDQKCVMIVVDTLARAMAGGDENLAKDMGVFVTHIDRLRAATGATADIIHHTGKDKAKGARGSSALRAATDTELEIEPGRLSVAKQRDLAKVDDFAFELESVEVGHRADGKPVTACVVKWIAASEFDDSVSPAAQDMLGILERLVAVRSDELEEQGAGPDAQAWVTWSEWQDEALTELKGARRGTVKRTTLFGFRKELFDARKIEKNAKKEWRVKATN